MRYTLRMSLVLSIATATMACGQEQDVRYFEQGGVTYRETKTKVRRPVREIEYQDQQQTFYHEKYNTQMQTVRQYRYQPVPQYYWEPRVHDRWNIFRGPHLAYHLRPYTVWQAQTRTAQLPVTQRTIEPEVRTVKMAVPKLSFREEDVVTRTAVAPAGSSQRFATAPLAQQPVIAWNLTPNRPNDRYGWASAPVYLPAGPQIAYSSTSPAGDGPAGDGGLYGVYGGVAQLEGDPPRYGGHVGSNAGAWQARRDTTESR